MKKYIKPTAEIFETEVSENIMQGSFRTYGLKTEDEQLAKEWYFEDEEDW